MEGAATSITFSVSAASSSKLIESAVDARTIRMLPGMHWRKGPKRKELSVEAALSPSSYCIWRSNCVGLRSPSSSVLKSYCSLRCSEAIVRLMSWLLMNSPQVASVSDREPQWQFQMKGRRQCGQTLFSMQLCLWL